MVFLLGCIQWCSGLNSWLGSRDLCWGWSPGQLCAKQKPSLLCNLAAPYANIFRHFSLIGGPGFKEKWVTADQQQEASHTQSLRCGQQKAMSCRGIQGRVRRAAQGPVPFCSLLEASTQPDFWVCLFFFSVPPSSVTHLPVQRQDLLAFFLWETSGWVSMEESEVNKMSQMLGPGRGPTLSAFELHWPLPHLGRKLSELFAHQLTSPVGNQCPALLLDAATRIPDPALIPHGHWRVLCYWL